MAYKNKIIFNKVTGQSIRFLTTSVETEGLARPPYLIQKVVFTLLKPVALAAGFRVLYEEFID